MLVIARQFLVTALWTTPTCACYLGEVAQKEGIDPRLGHAVQRFVAGESGRPVRPRQPKTPLHRRTLGRRGHRA
jgi:phenylacetate-coenzyme A ligase PaaK-like adenylate-forming protein